MPRTRPAYPPEFKAQIVELARSGRSFSALAREFEPSLESIRNWVRQADLDEGISFWRNRLLVDRGTDESAK